LFRHRTDAGQQLARALSQYRDKNPLVLAIPKGGIAVAREVARFLEAPMSVVITRKLPFPDNPESGFGAIAEDGSVFLHPMAEFRVPRRTIESIIREQEREIERRVRVLRKGTPLPGIEGRTVILVDDGIAMGSTMRASIKLCRKLRAQAVIVAAPVSGRETAEDMRKFADGVVILEKPVSFRAVAQVYQHWYDVSDQEAVELLEKHEQDV